MRQKSLPWAPGGLWKVEETERGDHDGHQASDCRAAVERKAELKCDGDKCWVNCNVMWVQQYSPCSAVSSDTKLLLTPRPSACHCVSKSALWGKVSNEAPILAQLIGKCFIDFLYSVQLVFRFKVETKYDFMILSAGWLKTFQSSSLLCCHSVRDIISSIPPAKIDHRCDFPYCDWQMSCVVHPFLEGFRWSFYKSCVCLGTET